MPGKYKKLSADTLAMSQTFTLEDLRAMAGTLGHQVVPSTMPLKSMQYEKVRGLFHKAWGAAHGSPDYDKEVWMELDNALKVLVSGTK